MVWLLLLISTIGLIGVFTHLFLEEIDKFDDTIHK
jgi:hypothetical protein